MPCVSVIVPMFRAESTIADCVASALAQEGVAIEVIVVDDCSPDGSAAIVSEMARREPRVRLLAASVNGGPGAARNLGIDAARGEWIAPLDADDRMCPGRLTRLLENAARLDADMAADNVLLCPDGRTEGAERLFNEEDIAAGPVITAARFVERNINRRGGGRVSFGFLKPVMRRAFIERHALRYDGTRFAEDYLFYLRLLLAGARLVSVAEPGYLYTVRENSLTVGHSADDLAFLERSERALLEHPAVRADTALRDAMERHVQSVGRALAWFRFVCALKARRPRQAMALLTREPQHAVHVGRESLATLVRLARIS